MLNVLTIHSRTNIRSKKKKKNDNGERMHFGDELQLQSMV